jgi:ATP-dependent Zn protease
MPSLSRMQLNGHFIVLTCTKEKEIVAHHETGHALVAAFTPGADAVHKKKVKEIVGERAAAVQELLSRNIALLEEIARELLQLEVMEAARFYEIIEGSAAIQGTRTAVVP